MRVRSLINNKHMQIFGGKIISLEVESEEDMIWLNM